MNHSERNCDAIVGTDREAAVRIEESSRKNIDKIDLSLDLSLTGFPFFDSVYSKCHTVYSDTRLRLEMKN